MTKCFLILFIKKDKVNILLCSPDKARYYLVLFSMPSGTYVLFVTQSFKLFTKKNQTIHYTLWQCVQTYDLKTCT